MFLLVATTVHKVSVVADWYGQGPRHERIERVASLSLQSGR